MAILSQIQSPDILGHVSVLDKDTVMMATFLPALQITLHNKTNKTEC